MDNNLNNNQNDYVEEVSEDCDIYIVAPVATVLRNVIEDRLIDAFFKQIAGKIGNITMTLLWVATVMFLYLNKDIVADNGWTFYIIIFLVLLGWCTIWLFTITRAHLKNSETLLSIYEMLFVESEECYENDKNGVPVNPIEISEEDKQKIADIIQSSLDKASEKDDVKR